ncbi:MAG: hypothetical protein IPK10_05170 [Bacteroidetes bacterium]|nr:hypothetical protein [Bacteroidota bacterium]
MLRVSFFCILSFLCIQLYGQSQEEKTSLSPFLVFDSYYSFIGNKSADVWGFRGGVKYHEKWRFGIGYNFISSDIVENKILPTNEIPYAKNDTVKAQLFFRYYPVMAEYIHYNKGPWQISTPLQIGYGQSYFQYFDKSDSKRRIFKKGVVASQLGVNAQYKIVKWIGITSGIGYRIMLVNNKEIDAKMNSPIFAIGIKIYLSEVVKSIKGE